MPLSPNRRITADRGIKISKDNVSDSHLPRSMYVPQKDPRANLRELVDSVLSDRFMIFLSLILVPIILLPFVLDLSPEVLEFFEICDWSIVLLFVAEYATKLYAAQSRWAFFKSPWHIVDLIIVVFPFIQLFPIGLAINGSPSLLLRLLRLPRALAVGGRAIAGRRTTNHAIASQIDEEPETLIRQVDSDLKTVHYLTWDELKAHMADSGRQEWIDVSNVSEDGFRELSEVLQISEPHFKSNLVDDIYPHIDYVKKTSFIFLQSGALKYPEHADHYLRISRLGIIVICGGTKIITVSRHGTSLFKNVLSSNLQVSKDDAVVPILYGILNYMLNDYKSILSEIEMEVIKISSTPRSKLPKDFLERIYQLDKEVSRLVSNLVHFKELLNIVTSRSVPLDGFDKNSEEAFHVLQDGAVYLNEIADDVLENLRSIIDLYINETSFETNRILKILAVITAISVIPSAVSGLLGTNLLDVPYGANLWQVVFIIGIVMSFVTYTFYKLGWLKS